MRFAKLRLTIRGLVLLSLALALVLPSKVPNLRHVDERWLDAVGKPDEMEEAMLDMRPEREAGSRLCCQIEVTEALDGLVLRLPEYQM